MANFDLDLHGHPAERPHVTEQIQRGLAEARRRGAGLRLIHGRGEDVMRRLVHDILDEMQIEYVRGWANPGETRVEARAVRRFRSSG